MTCKIYLSKYTNDNKDKLIIREIKEIFDDVLSAYNYAETEFATQSLFEHYAIHKITDNELLYFKDCRGFIENNTNYNI